MSQEKKYCLRCGRELKSEESKKTGFGPSCLKKHLAEKRGGLLKYLEKGTQNAGGKEKKS